MRQVNFRVGFENQTNYNTTSDSNNRHMSGADMHKADFGKMKQEKKARVM